LLLILPYLLLRTAAAETETRQCNPEQGNMSGSGTKKTLVAPVISELELPTAGSVKLLKLPSILNCE
jgi:hypothetical protein